MGKELINVFNLTSHQYVVNNLSKQFLQQLFYKLKSFSNDICLLNQNYDVFSSGSVDGGNQLIIKGRFQQKQIENVLRRYISKLNILEELWNSICRFRKSGNIWWNPYPAKRFHDYFVLLVLAILLSQLEFLPWTDVHLPFFVPQSRVMH